MTNKQYSVKIATKQEMSVIIDYAAKEGWNPGLHDAECFYQADHNGFFVGKLAEKIIAVGSGVKYQPEFAFFGLYVVYPDYRGQGYGLKLTRAILDPIAHLNVGLDGVPKMQNQYAKLGFKLAHYNTRYGGKIKKPVTLHPSIIDLDKVDFNALLTFDRYYFPATRQNFLKKWISQPNSKALGFLENDNLSGYGVIRKCINGFKIGPLFANSSQIASELFLSLAAHANTENIFLDVINDNENAVSLAEKFKLKTVFTTARMYTKKFPDINLNHIYGITSFELG